MRGSLTVDKGSGAAVSVDPSGAIGRNAGEKEINALVTWN